MRSTSAGKDTQHKQGQPLKKLACVSNHRGSLLNLPEVNSIEELIKAYYRTQIVAEIDHEKMEKVINYNILTYNNPHTSSHSLPLNLTRMEEIDLLLQTNKFMNINKKLAYQHDYVGAVCKRC